MNVADKTDLLVRVWHQCMKGESPSSVSLSNTEHSITHVRMHARLHHTHPRPSWRDYITEMVASRLSKDCWMQRLTSNRSSGALVSRHWLFWLIRIGWRWYLNVGAGNSSNDFKQNVIGRGGALSEIFRLGGFETLLVSLVYFPYTSPIRTWSSIWHNLTHTLTHVHTHGSEAPWPL